MAEEKTMLFHVDMDFAQARQDAAEYVHEIEQASQDVLDRMPNAFKVLSGAFNQPMTVANQLIDKYEEMSQKTFKSQEAADAYLADQQDTVNNMRSELNASFSFRNDVRTKAMELFSSMTDEMQNTIDQMFPSLMRAVSTSIYKINQRIPSKDLRHAYDYVGYLNQSADINTMLSPLKLNAAQRRNLLETAVYNTMDPSRFLEFQQRRFGSVSTAKVDYGNVYDMPKSFDSSFFAGGYVRDANRAQRQGVLTSAGQNALFRLLSRNNIAVKAAYDSGIAKRNAQSDLLVKNNITAEEFENFREALFDQYQWRVEGTGENHISLSEIKDREFDKELIERLMRRSKASTTAGRAYMALQDIDALTGDEFFSEEARADRTRYSKLHNEPKRSLDAYQVAVEKPFSEWDKNGITLLNESQMTRVLGRGKWHHNQFVDSIIVKDLTGYNPENQEQNEYLKNLFTNGETRDGKHFVAQTIHGTGQDLSVRMIDEQLMKQREAEEEAWAKAHGFRGSFFKNYENEQFAEMAARGELTIENLGKHYDAINRNWTPSQDIGLRLGNRKIAVVKLENENGNSVADGGGFFPLDHGQQTRIGVAGKGSLFSLGAKNNREFAERLGLLDDDQRFMVTGVNGEKFDISDYAGFVDVSMIKNLNAYRDENGQLPDNDTLSNMFTAAVNRYGMNEVVNYGHDKHQSLHAGTQMSAFLKMDPLFQMVHVGAMMDRINALQTEQGKLKYVFGDQNTDPLSRAVNENPQLLYSDTSAQKRVSDYIETLVHDMITGDVQNLGNDELGTISDIRAAVNPIQALAISEGGLSKETIKKARAVLSEAYDGRDFTDQEITDMFVLPQGTVVDFAHKDQDTIGVSRAPTGYKNMYMARNIASLVEPLYDAFELSKEGIFLSHADNNRDQKTLQGLDYDSDKVKVFTKQYADLIKNALEDYPEAVGDTDIKTNPIVYEGLETADTPDQMLKYAQRAFKVVLGMGAGSADIRTMMMDLSNPLNSPYVRGAEKLQKVYDKAGTEHKKPVDVSTDDPDMKKVLGLGAEYGKFIERTWNAVVDENNTDFFETNNGRRVLRDEYADRIKRMSNGIYVDIEALKNANIDKTNLPSVNMPTDILGALQLETLLSNPQTEQLMQPVHERFNAIAEAINQNLDVSQYGDKTQLAMRAHRELLTQFAHNRTSLSSNQTDVLQRILSDASREIRIEANNLAEASGTGGINKDGKQISVEEYINQKMRETGLTYMQRNLDEYGFTEGRLTNLFGDENPFGETTQPEIQTVSAAMREQEEEEKRRELEQARIEKEKAEQRRKDAAKKRTSYIKKRYGKTIKELNEDPEYKEFLKIINPLFDKSIEGILEREYYGESLNEDELIEKAYEDIQDQLGIGSMDAIGVDASELESAKRKAKGLKASIVNTNATNTEKVKVDQVKKDVEQTRQIVDAVSSDQYNPLAGFEENFGNIVSGIANVESSKVILSKLLEDIKTNKSKVYQQQYKQNQTEAEKFFGIEGWKLNNTFTQPDEIQKHVSQDVFNVFEPLIKSAQLQHRFDYMHGTRSWAEKYTSDQAKAIAESVYGIGDTYNKQKNTLENYQTRISDLQSAITQFEESRKRFGTDDEALDKITLEKMQNDLNKAISDAQTGTDKIQKQNYMDLFDEITKANQHLGKEKVTPEQQLDLNFTAYSNFVANLREKLTFAQRDKVVSQEQYETLDSFIKDLEGLTREDYFAQKMPTIIEHKTQTERQIEEDIAKAFANTTGEDFTRDEYIRIAANRYRTQWEQYRENNATNENAVALADLMLEQDQVDKYTNKQSDIFEANQNLRDVRDQQRLAQLQAEQNNTILTPQQKLDFAVLTRQAELQKLAAEAPEGSDLQAGYRALLSDEALLKYWQDQEGLMQLSQDQTYRKVTADRLQASAQLSGELLTDDEFRSIARDRLQTQWEKYREEHKGNAAAETLAATMLTDENLNNLADRELEQYQIKNRIQSRSDRIARDRYELEETGQRMSRTDYLNMRQDQRLNQYDEWILHARTDDERQRLQRDRDDQARINAFDTRLGNQYDADEQLRLVKEQQHLASMQLQLTGHTQSRQDRIDNLVSLRQAELNKEIAYAPVGSEYEKQLRQLVTPEALSAYRNVAARQIQIQDEALARRDEMQAAQSGFNAQQAIYVSENFRRMHGSRYTKTMLGRMYDERMNYGQQLRQNEFNYKQRIREEEDRQATLNAQLETATDQADIDRINNRIKDSQQAVEGYRQALKNTQNDLDQFKGTNQAIGAVFDKITVSVTRLAQQLGRRMFQKAIQEAKRFVMEFDASMTEIQTITQKSDAQMQSVRSDTIDRAIRLRTSVGNVSQVEASLYRQGLSDAEVADRSEAIIKFATVTGSKVQDATKIITTALQNGLVESAEEAMDALTALGDNAATTAVEIGKAMQKCAAAAKVAGVSYGELTSMITVMTSTTQLSGTQVGTALNTLFSRLRQVQSTGYVSDRNGDTTDLSTIETALRLAGIDLRSDQNTFRTPTEIMYDIAKNWNNMSDVQRANITTSVAGVRAGNMFSTLMEGMAEDNGETFAKYLGLAEDSEGMTESKYEIAAKSLRASLDELKSTFDGFIENLVESGAIKGIVDAITGFVNGLRLITENGGNVVTTIVAITGAVAALTTVIKVLTGDVAGAVVGGTLLLGTIGLGVASGIGNAQAQNKINVNEKVLNEYTSEQSEKENRYQKLIDDTEKLGKSYQELGNKMKMADKVKLQNNLAELIIAFPELGAQIDDVSDSLKHWSDIVDGAKTSLDSMKTKSEQTRSDLAQILYESTRASSAEEYERKWKEEHNLGFDFETLNEFNASVTGETGRQNYLNMLVNKNAINPNDERNTLLTAKQYMEILDSADYEEAVEISKVIQDEFAKVNSGTKTLSDGSQELFEDWENVYDLSLDELIDFLTKNQDLFASFESLGFQGHETALSSLIAQREALQNHLDAGNLSVDAYNEIMSRLTNDYAEALVKYGQDKTNPIAQAIALRSNLDSDFVNLLNESDVTSDVELSNLYRQWLVDENMDSDISWKRKNLSDMVSDENTANILKAYFNRNALDIQKKLQENNVVVGSDEIDVAVQNNALTSAGFVELVSTYQHKIGDSVISYLYDGLLESTSENGWLYELVESLLTDWSEYVSDRVYGLLHNKGLNKIYDSDKNMKKALDNSINDMIMNAASYSEAAGLDAGLDFNSMTDDQRQIYIDYIAKTIESNVRNAASGEVSRLKYIRANNPDATPFTVNGEAFESIDQARAYIRQENNRRRIARESGNMIPELRESDIMKNGQTYYQDANSVFESLYAQNLQENPEYNQLRYTLLQQALSASNYNGFMANINKLENGTWATDNMSKILPKELYGALNAAKAGTIDWALFQQMLQNYQLGQSGYGHELNMEVLNNGVGAGFMTALQTGDQAGMLSAWQDISSDQTRLDVFTTAISGYEGATEILKKLAEGAHLTEEEITTLNNAMKRVGAEGFDNWSKAMKRGRDNLEQLTGESSDVNNFFNSMNANLTKVANNQWFRDQWKAGKRSRNVLEQISAQTGFGVELLNDNKWVKENKGVLEKRLKQAEQADLQTIEEYSNTLAQGLQDQLNDGSLSIDLSQVQVGTNGSISIDLSGVADATSGEMSSQMQLIMDQLKAWGINATLHVKTEGEGDGAKYTAWVEIDDTSLGDIIKKRPSGGGGGGKSQTDHLLEAQKHRASVDDHMLKMIQFRRTRYKNAGELTNENALIEQENRERRRQIQNQRDNIDELRTQMSIVKEGSDDWYKLRDAIQAAEEAIAEHTEAIRENEKAIKENRKQIRQYKIDIQDMISGELDNREQQRRQRLQGTVDMENTILDIIKKRYQDEWDLVKKDIENKKQALEQEKSLIDERLNARKQAAQEASKYEELANLQAQLALIEKDSSRTSDAAKLRDQIRKLQDELSWSTAEQEAGAQKQALDDRIKGYELYTNQYEEWLENFLSDNNNFANELNDVMKKSREDLINWLKLNDEEYANSTKEQQDLMVQNWGDMYDEMKGLSDQYWRDYWNQVAAVMTNRESFMDFMMDSEEYRKASDERKRQLREQWNEAWTLWNNARLGGAALVSDEHAGEHDGDDIDDSPKYRYKVKWEVKSEDGKLVKKGTAKGDYYSTKADAKKAAKRLAEEQAVEAQIHPSDTITYDKYVAYKHGGLVDYTGPAWVDGSKTRPEAFLSAEDTATMRSFLDSFATIRMPNFASLISDNMFGEAKGFTVEKLNIEINEAELKEDPDYEQVARRVGEEFVRELSKQGVQTANFAFSR